MVHTNDVKLYLNMSDTPPGKGHVYFVIAAGVYEVAAADVSGPYRHDPATHIPPFN